MSVATAPRVRVGPLAWLPEELDAWQVADLVPTCRWVREHVAIPEGVAALPGPLDVRLIPYAEEIWDALDDPDIDTVTLVCGTQTAKSTMIYAWMLSTVVQLRAPVLLVMPAEDDARSVAGDVLRKYVQNCGPARGLLADGEGSLTREGYQFLGCDWAFGWSNSAASLARRARRLVIYDEVEKFPPWVGRESNPIRLGDARLRTYRETTGVKSVRISSPTTPDGLIWQSYEQSDKRAFWVPCGACGEYQPFQWGQFRWPHGPDGHSSDGEEICERNLTRYVCRHCGGEWTDAGRYDAVRRGRWAKAGQRVRSDGVVAGQATRPRHHHAGFHLPAFASLFVRQSWWTREWLEVQGSAAELQGFVNQELGLVYEETEAEISEEPLRKHRAGYLMGQAPPGVQVVVAGIDAQRGWFAVEARGWGYGLESWLLEARVIQTERELHDWLRDRRYERVGDDGQPVEAPAGREVERGPWSPLPIRLGLIDSGDQTADIYELCHSWGDVDLRPTKGADVTASALKIIARTVQRNPRTGRSYGVKRLRYDFEALHWKDVQARLAQTPEAGPGYYHLPTDLPDDWFKQFLSEHKVVDRKRGKRGRSGRPIRIWKTRTTASANHWWDAAILCCLATDPQVLNLRALPDPSVPPPSPPRRRRPPNTRPEIRTKY